MAFSLHPITPADAVDVTRVFQAAFANDHIMKHFYPHTPLDVKWKQDLTFFEGLIAEGDKYGGRMTKVVEGGSKTGWVNFLIGFVGFLVRV